MFEVFAHQVRISSSSFDRIFILQQIHLIMKSYSESYSKLHTKEYNASTSRDTRLVIQTTLQFKVSYDQIQKELNVTRSQIIYAKNHSLTFQHKAEWDRKLLLQTFERNKLQSWLEASSSHTRIFWQYISTAAPELSLQVREKIIVTTIYFMNYIRRVSKRKDFSDNSQYMHDRVKFARWDKTWSWERLCNQIFFDEMWINERTHIISWVIVQEDESNRYASHNVQHNTAKLRSEFCMIRLQIKSQIELQIQSQIWLICLFICWSFNREHLSRQTRIDHVLKKEMR